MKPKIAWFVKVGTSFICSCCMKPIKEFCSCADVKSSNIFGICQGYRKIHRCIKCADKILFINNPE